MVKAADKRIMQITEGDHERGEEIGREASQIDRYQHDFRIKIAQLQRELQEVEHTAAYKRKTVRRNAEAETKEERVTDQ